jgi:hypothetical protein
MKTSSPSVDGNQVISKEPSDTPGFNDALAEPVRAHSSQADWHLRNQDVATYLIPWLLVPFNGAGGGNRTHGLGIMRPSLYH